MTTLKFSKPVTIANSSTKAEIEVTYGKYRNVNQINTSNEKIYESGHKFEDGLISLKEMIQVLNS